MESNKLKIGWIGTGVMGKSMCKHLLTAGYELLVYSRTMSKTEELKELGAIQSDVLSISQQCDVVFLMLGYPKDVEDIVLGENGIINTMKQGAYLVDHTTSSPELAKAIYNECNDRGIYSYDAPVSGGDIGAKNGKLVVMVGGSKEQFSSVENIMKCYSSKISLLGSAGFGQNTKMCNQIMISGAMISVCEALLYGYKANLDLAATIELLGGGAASSFSLNTYGPRILKRDFEPGFFVEHFVKDMGIALEECKKMGIKLQGLELAYSLYNIMINEGWNKKGTQGLYLAIEKLNNIDIN